MLPPNYCLGTEDSRDRYRIIGYLGQGGFGTTYLAQDVIEDGLRVIKVIRDDVVSTDENAVRRFEQEIAIAQQIEAHPNVLGILRSVTADQSGINLPYFVTEYVSGGDLATRIARQSGVQFEVQDLLEMMQQLVNGLAAIHRRAVHRDLNPRNVLVADTILKICDFGLARPVDVATRSVTAKGWGTWAYMAPETWQGQNATPATDIYSLGVMFFEVATIGLPFRGDHPLILRQAHLSDPVPRPSLHRPGLDPRLDKLIVSMMAKEAEARPVLGEVEEIISTILSVPLPPLSPALDRVVAAARVTQEQRNTQIAAARAEQEAQAQLAMRAGQEVDNLAAQLHSLILQVNAHIDPPVELEEDNTFPQAAPPFNHRVIRRSYAYNSRHLKLELYGVPFQNRDQQGQPLSGIGQRGAAVGTIGVTYLICHMFEGGHSILMESGPHGLYLLLDSPVEGMAWHAYAIEKADVTPGEKGPLHNELNYSLEAFVELLRAPDSNQAGLRVRSIGRVTDGLLADLLNALVGSGFADAG